MAFHQRFIQDFLKTRRILREAQANAAGWRIGQIHPETFGAEMTACYIYDAPTGWTWMSTVSRDTFVRVSSDAHAHPDVTELIRGGLAHLIARRADGKSTPNVGDQDWENQLAFLACAYAGTTQCWELADRMQTEGQFVVIHYRRPKASNGMLRPFVVPAEEATGIIQAEHFKDMIDWVVSRDHQRHPEWLDGG